METQKRIIVPLKFNEVYLEAWKKAKKLSEKLKINARLPSNVLLDEYIVRAGKWEEIEKILPGWARELFVYLRAGRKFIKGRDVINYENDRRGRRWTLPASYVPSEAIGAEGVGLFVDPAEITLEEDMAIIHPDSVIVLKPFIQEYGDYGRLDERTKIPLKTDKKEVIYFNNNFGGLFRYDDTTVAPIVRDLGGMDGRGYFFFDTDIQQGNLYSHFGVGIEVSETDLKKLLELTKNELAELSISIEARVMLRLQKLAGK